MLDLYRDSNFDDAVLHENQSTDIKLGDYVQITQRGILEGLVGEVQLFYGPSYNRYCVLTLFDTNRFIDVNLRDVMLLVRGSNISLIKKHSSSCKNSSID